MVSMGYNSVRRVRGFLLAMIVLALSACGPAPDHSTPSEGSKFIKEHLVELYDGRQVTCLTFAYAEGGGISCDWSGR